jgi:glycosyltransferase involved in cell wall biosynthesis
MLDISVIITFHSEGVLAIPTLRALDACLRHARDQFISCETICVLDRANAPTEQIVSAWASRVPSCTVLRVNNGDLGLSRNSGVREASGSFIAILDGDDYLSSNWLSSCYLHFTRHDMARNVVLHPEYVVNFGTQRSFFRQVSMAEQRDTWGLFWDNWWCSWSFGPREIYAQLPYARNEITSSGFGFEDWHWNCEVLSNGFLHDIVPETVGFYRRKTYGLLQISKLNQVLPRFTTLFTRSSVNGAAST